MGVGKIFHTGEHAIPEGAFDEYGFRGSSGSPFTKEELSLEKQAPFNRIVKNGKEYRLPLNGFPADRHWRSTNTFDWGPVDVPDEDYSDTQKTNWAIEKLGESHEKPFFLALGFDRPHQPLYNPTRFHEMYPPESVVLPSAMYRAPARNTRWPPTLRACTEPSRNTGNGRTPFLLTSRLFPMSMTWSAMSWPHLKRALTLTTR
jgi:hypothetical protein